MHGTFSYRDYLKSILNDKGIDINIDSLSTESVTLYFEGLVKLLRANYPEITIHIAQTVYSPYYEKFKDQLYLTGFVFTYSENPFNNEKLHRKIIENDLKLDYIEHDWYADSHVSEPMINQLNLMYIEPFMKLAEFYNSQGEIIAARKWKNKALLIAKKSNNQEMINKLEDMN